MSDPTPTADDADVIVADPAGDPAAPARDPATDPAARLARFVRRPFLRALLAGLLIAGSLPPWGFWPLAFGGLALLHHLLADASWKARLGRGFTLGLALFVPTIIWITQLTEPGYVVAVLVFALLVGASCVLVPPGPGRALGLVAAWTLCESLRTAWPFGGAPLSLLAVGQVAGPLAGIARIGGVLGIAIATVAVGVAVAAAARRQVVPAAVALASVVALLVLATVAPHGHDTGRTLDIAFVQGGGEQGTRAINSDSRVVFERHLDASAPCPADAEPGAACVPEGMDLVLWPENVVDTKFDVQDAEEGRELQELAQELDAPVLVGTVEGVDEDNFRNSQQVVRADGTWGDRYVKVQRVPFGEWVPFRSFIERFAPDTLARRDATVSHQSGLLRTDPAPIATVISWEVFFGHRARSAVRAGGQLLYNPTNGSTYTGTFVQTQQVASSRLRAIETGRWEVQVAPTGFSAFVSPEGVVHQRTGTSEQAVRVRHDVPLRTGETWYVRWGDLPPRVLAVALLAAAWALHLLDRRRRTRPVPRTDGGNIPTPA